jgi:hypothetical protein
MKGAPNVQRRRNTHFVAILVPDVREEALNDSLFQRLPSLKHMGALFSGILTFY